MGDNKIKISVIVPIFGVEKYHNPVLIASKYLSVFKN